MTTKLYKVRLKWRKNDDQKSWSTRRFKEIHVLTTSYDDAAIWALNGNKDYEIESISPIKDLIET